MVLLSFSVKEQELRAEIKVRTTRLYTPEKYALWQSTLLIGAPGNAPRLLNIWWKSRSKDARYKMFDRWGSDLYKVMFHELNGRSWPFRSRDSGLITPMTTDEFRQYLREEGFEGQMEEFLRFFEDHYAPLEGKVFQSIAFPRQNNVYPRTVV